MKRQLVSTASCVLLLCLCLPISAFASITITNAYTSAGVNDNGNSFDQDTSYAAAGAMTTATIAGFSATHNTMYGQSGFSHVTALERQGGEFDSSSSRGSVSFTALTNDGYSISGSFENSARGYLYARLYDFTATAFVYEAFMSSNGPAIFDLAGPGLNGFLIAGHEYQWIFETNTVAGAVGDDGVIASGYGSIQFFQRRSGAIVAAYLGNTGNGRVGRSSPTENLPNGRGLNSSASNLQPSRPAPGLPGVPTWQCPETWGLAFC